MGLTSNLGCIVAALYIVSHMIVPDQKSNLSFYRHDRIHSWCTIHILIIILIIILNIIVYNYEVNSYQILIFWSNLIKIKFNYFFVEIIISFLLFKKCKAMKSMHYSKKLVLFLIAFDFITNYRCTFSNSFWFY